MAECLKFARPIVRRGASLYANQAWWQLLEECQDVTTLQLTANDHLASGINSVHLEDRLGDIEPDCRDRLHNSSFEPWEPQQRPHPWHSRAGGGAVHSIKSGSEWLPIRPL